MSGLVFRHLQRRAVDQVHPGEDGLEHLARAVLPPDDLRQPQQLAHALVSAARLNRSRHGLAWDGEVMVMGADGIMVGAGRARTISMRESSDSI